MTDERIQLCRQAAQRCILDLQHNKPHNVNRAKHVINMIRISETIGVTGEINDIEAALEQIHAADDYVYSTKL